MINLGINAVAFYPGFGRQTMELQQQQRCRFGLGLDRLLINLLWNSNSHFQFSISTERNQHQISALRKCRPLCVILKKHRYNESEIR